MSWDILIQDFPAGITNVDEISDDFAPKPIGVRVELIARIREVLPAVDFRDPAWGNFEGDGYSIEFSMGNDEECHSVVLHVRGGPEAVAAVAVIVEHLGLRAYDIGAEAFFSLAEAQASFAEWRAYRNKVVSSTISPLPKKPEDPAAGN